MVVKCQAHSNLLQIAITWPIQTRVIRQVIYSSTWVTKTWRWLTLEDHLLLQETRCIITSTHNRNRWWTTIWCSQDKHLRFLSHTHSSGTKVSLTLSSQDMTNLILSICQCQCNQTRWTTTTFTKTKVLPKLTSWMSWMLKSKSRKTQGVKLHNQLILVVGMLSLKRRIRWITIQTVREVVESLGWEMLRSKKKNHLWVLSGHQ